MPAAYSQDLRERVIAAVQENQPPPSKDVGLLSGLKAD